MWESGLQAGFGLPAGRGGGALEGPASVASLRPRKDADPAAYRIHAGDVYLYGGRTLLNVTRVIVHPDYIYAHLGADVALLQLSHSVKYTANVRPVKLPSALLEVTPEDECWVTGWGTVMVHRVYGVGFGRGSGPREAFPDLATRRSPGGWVAAGSGKESPSDTLPHPTPCAPQSGDPTPEAGGSLKHN